MAFKKPSSTVITIRKARFVIEEAEGGSTFAFITVFTLLYLITKPLFLQIELFLYSFTAYLRRLDVR